MKRWGITFPLDGVPLPAHREVLREAESLGYTDAWTAEIDGPDAFVPVALASAWTEKLHLGTAIANVFTRGPALLAQQATACAEATPGRFSLGIGSSSPAIVENWNGGEFRRPLERVRETLAFLRSVFAGERAANETLGVTRFRIGRRFADPPPIYVAALREKMLALAGSSAEGVVINWLGPDALPADAMACTVKLRSTMRPVAARLEPGPEGVVSVRLDQPQFGISPGQACVFYDGDRMLGGGWIARQD